MYRLLILTLLVLAAPVASAAPRDAKPFLRQDPGHAAIVFMDCTVRIRGHRASRAAPHGLSGGQPPAHDDYLGEATLARVATGGKPIMATRIGDALIFPDLAPGWYRLAGVQADVAAVVPSEARTRNPGTTYIYSYPFNPQDEPDALTFQVVAGEMRFLGRLWVQEDDAPRVDKDGSIREWQKDNHGFRIERNRHEELESLRGLARAAKNTPWAGAVRARIEVLESGAPADSTVQAWR